MKDYLPLFFFLAFILTFLGGLHEGAKLWRIWKADKNELIAPTILSFLYVGVKAGCYVLMSIYAIGSFVSMSSFDFRNSRYFLLYVKGNEQLFWLGLMTLVLVPFYCVKYFFFRRNGGYRISHTLIEIPFAAFIIYLSFCLSKGG